MKLVLLVALASASLGCAVDPLAAVWRSRDVTAAQVARGADTGYVALDLRDPARFALTTRDVYSPGNADAALRGCTVTTLVTGTWEHPNAGLVTFVRADAVQDRRCDDDRGDAPHAVDVGAPTRRWYVVVRADGMVASAADTDGPHEEAFDRAP